MQSKEGPLAIAEGGTVFLDEVGEIPVDLQAKMLRALQEKEIRPVGSTKLVPINVRILAATNRDLEHAVAHGAFRRDLYFYFPAECSQSSDSSSAREAARHSAARRPHS